MQKKKRESKIDGARLTRKTACPLIEQYLSSGLEPREFYNEVDWTDNQFFSWRKRYLEEQELLTEETQTANFHPIEITPPSTILTESVNEKFTIEISYPNGVTLRVYSRNTVHPVDLIKLY
jgi:transposase-like protein